MKKKPSPSGEPIPVTNTEIPAKQEPTPSLNIFRSITNLPLHRFIDCIVDTNLHSLIIPGQPADYIQPSGKELQTAWNGILTEFSEAVGTNEYRMYVNLYKEISMLKITYDQIQILIETLFIVYSAYLCEQLGKLLKYKARFNPKDPESYKAELEKCGRLSKGMKVRLDLKMMQFEAIQEKHKADEAGEKAKDGRGYFISMLITLSDHAKYPIQDTIVVQEYCERIKRFNKYVETLNNKKR